MSKEKVAQAKLLLKQALEVMQELPPANNPGADTRALEIANEQLVTTFLRLDYYARIMGFLADSKPQQRVLKGTQQPLPIKSTLAPAAHIPTLRGPMTSGLDVAQVVPPAATPPPAAPKKRVRASRADMDALG